MTTIDELRDIVYYIIRKLNDFIINVTTQPQPRQPIQYREMTEEERRRNDEEHENIRRRIQEIRRRLDTLIPPPSPTINEEIVDEEHENIMRRIQEIRRRLDTPTIREEIVDEEHENIMRRIQEIRRRLDTPTIREEIVDEEHENIMRQIRLYNPPSTPKILKDIYENLKEINDHHKPRCDSMEEFLENEIMKEKSIACLFNDKKREYEIRKEKIIEILELWKYDNISVDEIRERLNNL